MPMDEYREGLRGKAVGYLNHAVRKEKWTTRLLAQVGLDQTAVGQPGERQVRPAPTHPHGDGRAQRAAAHPGGTLSFLAGKRVNGDHVAGDLIGGILRILEEDAGPPGFAFASTAICLVGRPPHRPESIERGESGQYAIIAPAIRRKWPDTSR